jgi:hypothetical protein
LWAEDFEQRATIEETIFPEPQESVLHNNPFEIVQSPKSSQENSTNQDFSSFRVDTNTTSQISTEEIRQMIREEIQKALNGEFKEKMSERLQDVLKLIERSSQR